MNTSPKSATRGPLAALTAGLIGVATAAVLGFAVFSQASASADPAATAPEDAQVQVADSPAEGAADVTYIAECLDDNLVNQPTTFTTACGDANQSLNDLVWTAWGEDEATATGTLVTTDCEKSCVEGDAITTPATVKLSNLVKGEASVRYTLMTVTPAEGEAFEVELPGLEPMGDLTDEGTEGAESTASDGSGS